MKIHSFLALAALTGVLSTTSPAFAQGYPVAQLQCQANIGGVVTTGVVDISLFVSGSSASVGNASERLQMKVMILEGRGHEIPGTLNVIGAFNYGGARMDFDVMLTGGTRGTGQYWFNGASHRGTIFELQLVKGGFQTLDEYGVGSNFSCI